ncbi:hypothetical protein CA54_27320 [Symmachiella macrocystis]|uniref:Uncharacterized protein n=1 Tax=Symmachiella macrocystis TaxID=2527985 RepID=A0A5C6BR60_9PLAN|nr:hypothetical protein CA54_27320 [Symmachiella macrocystis]
MSSLRKADLTATGNRTGTGPRLMSLIRNMPLKSNAPTGVKLGDSAVALFGCVCGPCRWKRARSTESGGQADQSLKLTF